MGKASRRKHNGVQRESRADKLARWRREVEGDKRRHYVRLFDERERALIAHEMRRTVEPVIGTSSSGATHLATQYATLTRSHAHVLCGIRASTLVFRDRSEDEQPSCRTCQRAARHLEVDCFTASFVRNTTIEAEVLDFARDGRPSGLVIPWQ